MAFSAWKSLELDQTLSKKPLKGTCPKVAWSIPGGLRGIVLLLWGFMTWSVLDYFYADSRLQPHGTTGPDAQSTTEQLHLSKWSGKFPQASWEKMQRGQTSNQLKLQGVVILII